ncbi:MAG: hypothetical protein MJA27_14175 [Pseudanabaenales cyanobacterium]|nr:hypothetical protein [Pseudanabaenales cyanobacterium]
MWILTTNSPPVSFLILAANYKFTLAGSQALPVELLSAALPPGHGDRCEGRAANRSIPGKAWN